jgi:hypothetical protein
VQYRKPRSVRPALAIRNEWRLGPPPMTFQRTTPADIIISLGREGEQVIRREFLGLISGAASWPVAAKAQQSDVPELLLDSLYEGAQLEDS